MKNKNESIEIIPQKATKLFIAKRVMPLGWGLHGHNFFEIDFVVSGHAMSNINGKDYEIGKNSVIFMTPVDFHDIRNAGSRPIVTYNIIFATETMHNHVWSEIPMTSRVTTIDNATYVALKNICAHMLEEYTKSATGSENVLRVGIEWILLMISKASQADEVDIMSADKRVTAVLAYIFENFTSEISRDKAASIMQVSPIHFSKAFHAKVGTTFQNYLLELRLDYAKRLLTAVDWSVGRIASASGFNSSNYFSHAFIKKYGISPKNYADECRGSSDNGEEE